MAHSPETSLSRTLRANVQAEGGVIGNAAAIGDVICFETSPELLQSWNSQAAAAKEPTRASVENEPWVLALVTGPFANLHLPVQKLEPLEAGSRYFVKTTKDLAIPSSCLRFGKLALKEHAGRAVSRGKGAASKFELPENTKHSIQLRICNSCHWHVEKLLQHRCQSGEDQVLVKWKDYPESSNTWEPVKHLNAALKIDAAKLKP